MICNKLDLIEVDDLHSIYNFTYSDMIGSGMSSYVYRVTKKSNNHIYALKIQRFVNKTISNLLQSEMVVGNHIKNLGLNGYVLTPNCCYKVGGISYALEYNFIDGIELDYVKNISSDIIASNMFMLYNVLLILHHNDIYHNDISSSNILFDKLTNKFVLIDLGLACSKLCQNEELAKCNYLGNLKYIDPKIKKLLSKDFDVSYANRAQNDLYALFKSYNESFGDLFGKITNKNISKFNKFNYGYIESIKLWLPYVDANILNTIYKYL